MSKYGPRVRPPSERFWTHVRKGGPNNCWEWQGFCEAPGYGIFYAGASHLLLTNKLKTMKAHRFSWELANGQLAPREMKVLHHCDNPRCVNPAHLYLGTHADNARDRALRRRGKEHHQGGSANDNAKLTEADVIAIRALAKAGISQTRIAVLFGVNQPHISRIIRRVNWQHLE